MPISSVRSAVRPNLRRVARGALASAGALALSFAGIAIVPTQGALADPAVVTGTAVVQTTPGAFSGTVPAGVCTVTAVVLGGAGGSAVTTTTNSNGAGAKITATIPVYPGMSYSGTVGGGGGKPTGSGSADTAGPGGINGGGLGGTSGLASGVRHHGAGGGGFTDLSFDGTLALLAGGGGGAGGGHSTTTNGAGGNAGLPSGTGVADGSAGNVGKDYPNSAVVNGGAGGTSSPGAGGVNTQSAAQNGYSATLRVGGTGGDDTNPDAGGGGGGGYAGGGGGASTVAYNTQYAAPAGSEIAGAGGGGGSSFVAASTPAGAVSGISSALGAKITTATAGAGANGSLSLTWNPCSYDLAVTKSVTPTAVAPGGTATWTVAVTNNGPDAMTQGDTVTIADTLPGAGATTITGISVSGGSNSVLQSGSVDCGATVIGSAMPASLDCSRPYQPIGGAVSGVRGLNVGETLTVTYTQPITEPSGSSLTNTVTVTDRPATPGDNSASATVTVLTGPAAVDDTSFGNAVGTPVGLTVTTNDSGTFPANPVTLWDPSGGGSAITSPYTVAGEGTWTVSGTTITFTPEPGFGGDPTPVTYQVTDTNGLTATALVTITYLPAAADDSDLGNLMGSTVNVPVLSNDTGSFVANSIRILDGVTPVTTLTVPGEGEWRANSDGTVTFVPESGFLLDPTPVRYQVTDVSGDVVDAKVTITYVPTVASDVKNGNVIGAVAVLNVLTNDTGDFDAASLRIIDPVSLLPVTTLVVPGQGTWTTDTTGHITFTPLPGYLGNPTPVSYQITDVTGDTVTALATVTYLPTAADDQSLGNPQGKVVKVPILTNDQGLFDVSTARLLNNGVPTMNLVVAGQGTWHMNATTGEVTFTPLAGFRGDPTPVPYQVDDINGNVVSANVLITYLHPSAVSLALTGMSSQTPLMVAFGAIIMGLGALVIARMRRLTARHRA